MTQLDKPGTEQPALPTAADRLWGSRFWFQLLLVRPWLLVVGFWLVSILVGVFALEGIVKPKPLLTTGIESGRIASGRTVDGAGPTASPFTASGQPTAEAPVAGSDSSRQAGVPVWSLSAMVGACAVGCVMLSQWRRLARTAPRTRRSRSARILVRSTSPSSAAVPAPSLPLAQSRVIQLSHQSDSIARSKPGKSPGQRARRRAERRRRGALSIRARGTAQPPPRRTQANASKNLGPQPVISVVPASESHQLDWPEGSLAHQLDVRVKRSLSSFL
ncbi:hypothetical protein IQ241_05025 [Romeria aff. gracilis LEGE 07310]|uniref:Transmembrane protein n=1 Tax=Vasconcelosia minhoensis LEGE 07310 TaxID=915328 RepID=A0A8J7ABM3_9CYAN|nr:hypothetical protein [Romeria gracilis]MBE9076664.1 hypothetical protein [Romeria aff. gracilis LEGE 07310]